jgi:xanthosine utilization system XapX-like protein
MAGKKTVNYAEYAFLAGVIVAFVIGVLTSWIPAAIMAPLMAIMFILGIVVGVANIQEKESNSFLIAAIALLTAVAAWNMLLQTTLGLLGPLGNNLTVLITGFTGTLVLFISPAAFIVALKSVYNLASPE